MAPASTAITEAISTQGAAPSSWKRKAAQIRKGPTRKRRLTLLWVATRETAAVPPSRAAASAQRRTDTPRGHRAVRRASRNGATTRTPIASPVHHTDQVGQKSWAVSAPEATSTPVPTVALITMPIRAPRKTSARASRSRSRAVRNPTRRRRRQAHTGATVLPTVMASTGRIDGPSVTFTRNAPSATAGQARRPHSSRTTSAMPVGGQNGVTCPRTSCCCNPILALT
ncbi:hypothetical protein SAURM35S_06332 [Streptomyces aurantiogriseus]